MLEAIDANSGHLGPPPAAKIDVLVLDSVSSVLQPILGGGGSGNSFATRGYVLASHLACALSRVADRYCIAVVITNHMVAGGGADSEGIFGQKVALGESCAMRFSCPREARPRVRRSQLDIRPERATASPIGVRRKLGPTPASAWQRCPPETASRACLAADGRAAAPPFAQLPSSGTPTPTLTRTRSPATRSTRPGSPTSRGCSSTMALLGPHARTSANSAAACCAASGIDGLDQWMPLLHPGAQPVRGRGVRVSKAERRAVLRGESHQRSHAQTPPVV